MWVAAGVVAEKSGRVMELLISAAATKQLVVGKILGIGAAGLTQVVLVLAPAVLVLLSQDRLAALFLGPTAGVPLTLSGLSPALLLAFLVFFALGFALYAAIYAAAGSLLSRPGGPPDRRAAAVAAGHGRVLHVAAVAAVGHGRVHPARVVRPVLVPVRDAHAADGRAGRAMGARAVAGAAG